MSWILNQAEQLLEQVDQVAADTLKSPSSTPVKDTSRRGGTQEFYTPSSSLRHDTTKLSSQSGENSPDTTPISTRKQSSGSTYKPRKKSTQDDSLMDFLNGSSDTKTPSKSSSQAKGLLSDSLNGGVRTPSGTDNGIKLANGADSLQDTSSGSSSSSTNNHALENRLLKSEVAALEDEVASFANRVRSTQDTLNDTRNALTNAERQIADMHRERQKYRDQEREFQTLSPTHKQQISSLQKEVSTLSKEKADSLADHKDAFAAQGLALESLRKELETLRAEADNRKNASEQQQANISDTTIRLEDEVRELRLRADSAEQQAEDSKAALADQVRLLNAAKHDLEKVNREFTDYKTRASRVLQTKEKIIADLRDPANGASNDSLTPIDIDLASARRERDALEEELTEARTQIGELEIKIQEMQQQQETDAEWADGHFKDLENALADEKRLRADVEKERATQVEELTLEIEDAIKDKRNLQQQLRDAESEVEKVKGQLQRQYKQPSTNDAHAALTENLIKKQAQIEALIAEKSSMAIQLETESRKRDEVKIAMPATNGWEPATPLRPMTSILSGSNSTRINRRLKTAANFLDKFSIRLGVFLRRYPIARMFVIFYMMLLHMWVMIVLLTYTPEMHTLSSDSAMPTHPDHPGAVDMH